MTVAELIQKLTVYQQEGLLNPSAIIRTDIYYNDTIDVTVVSAEELHIRVVPE